MLKKLHSPVNTLYNLECTSYDHKHTGNLSFAQLIRKWVQVPRFLHPYRHQLSSWSDGDRSIWKRNYLSRGICWIFILFYITHKAMIKMATGNTRTMGWAPLLGMFSQRCMLKSVSITVEDNGTKFSSQNGVTFACDCDTLMNYRIDWYKFGN